jgi:hypothetical protein
MEAIKQGFSWPAFFFPIIWAMTKRLWGDAIGVFIGLLVLGFIFGRLGKVEGGALMLIASVLIRVDFLVNGNLWHEGRLAEQGYENVIGINARGKQDAVVRYIMGRYERRISEIFAET